MVEGRGNPAKNWLHLVAACRVLRAPSLEGANYPMSDSTSPLAPLRALPCHGTVRRSDHDFSFLNGASVLYPTWTQPGRPGASACRRPRVARERGIRHCL